MNSSSQLQSANNEFYNFQENQLVNHLFSTKKFRTYNSYPEKSSKGIEPLILEEAMYQISTGQIPDLRMICRQLFQTFFERGASHTAMQFIPVLGFMPDPARNELLRFIRNEKTNHVLIQNDLLKVVLIHWKPGKYSDVHGHPAGGCVFKVLQGQIEEKRYTTGSNPKLLAESTYSKGSMAYIDDRMAYHAVGNPFNEPAISLHVYTPGMKKNVN